MKNFSELTPDELKKLNKNSLVMIICSLQEQLANISRQLNFLTEQIALMNQRSFGRKTEQLQIPHQMSLFEDPDYPHGRTPRRTPESFGDPCR